LNSRKSLRGLVEYVYHSRDLAAEFQNCKPRSLGSLYLYTIQIYQRTRVTYQIM